MLQNSTCMPHVYKPFLFHVWVCTLPSLVPSCVTIQHAQPPSWFFTSFGVSFNTTSCTKHNIKENNTNKTKETKTMITEDYKNTTVMVLKQKFAMALFLCNWHFLIWIFQNIHETWQLGRYKYFDTGFMWGMQKTKMPRLRWHSSIPKICVLSTFIIHANPWWSKLRIIMRVSFILINYNKC